MAKIVVFSGSSKASVFPLAGSSTIGRGEECDLVLANVSVSRVHARITVADAGTVQVEDLGSNNGISINGVKTLGDVVHPGDELIIGRFSLTVISDSQKFVQGRYVAYLPKHGTVGDNEDIPTFTLDSTEVRKLVKQRHLIREAKVVLASRPSKFWHPEDRPLTFGKKAMVSTEGLFTVPLSVEINWNGNQHVISRRSPLVKLRVNDTTTKEALLDSGATFQVGATSFIYEVPD